MAALGSLTLIALTPQPVAKGVKWIDYKVSGTLKVDSVEASRRVILLNRRTMAYVTSRMSKLDGTFLFRKLPNQTQHDFFVAIGFDDRKIYDAEVMDYIKWVRTEETT